MNWLTDLKTSTENWGIYLILGIITIIMVTGSFFMESFTFEVLCAKMFNIFLGFGTLYLIRRFDFMGKDFSFQQAIKDGNIAAGITLAGLAIAAALLVSTVS